MPTIDQYVEDAGTSSPGSAAAAPPITEESSPVSPSFQLPEWLKAETGPGQVEDYIDHPLNIGRNIHFARMLRGLTGMFKRLNYAAIDVVVGGLGFAKKKPPVDISPSGGVQPGSTV